MTERQSTLAHEAAHAIGGLLAGHRIGTVRLGATRKQPDEAGSTSFDFAATPEVDLYGHLIAVLMGGMATGERPPSWPLQPDPDSRDSLAVARLVNHLKLSKFGYESAVALAAHWLADPLVKSAMATVAHALGQKGVLTDDQVRKALGPQMLAWFARADTDRHEDVAA